MANKQFTKGLEADREETGILKQVMEQDINEMLLGIRGTGVFNGLLVKPNSPSDNTVLVETGRVYNGTTVLTLSSQTQSGTFAVVASTKERWDMVTLYDSGGGTAAIKITQGTEADVGNALPPDILEDEICLAFVYINETVTVDILSGDISDRRVFVSNLFLQVNAIGEGNAKWAGSAYCHERFGADGLGNLNANFMVFDNQLSTPNTFVFSIPIGSLAGTLKLYFCGFRIHTIGNSSDRISGYRLMCHRTGAAYVTIKVVTGKFWYNVTGETFEETWTPEVAEDDLNNEAKNMFIVVDVVKGGSVSDDPQLSNPEFKYFWA